MDIFGEHHILKKINHRLKFESIFEKFSSLYNYLNIIIIGSQETSVGWQIIARSLFSGNVNGVYFTIDATILTHLYGYFNTRVVLQKLNTLD